MPGGSSGSDSSGAYLQMIAAAFDVLLLLFGHAHSGSCSRKATPRYGFSRVRQDLILDVNMPSIKQVHFIFCSSLPHSLLPPARSVLCASCVQMAFLQDRPQLRALVWDAACRLLRTCRCGEESTAS